MEDIAPSMAKISKPPVPAKLYKHFAAVTIVLTGAIAMFADEDQRAAAEQVQVRSTSAQSKSGSTPAYGEARLARADGNTQGSFGGEGGGYGAPMMSPGGGGNRSSIARRAVNTNRQSLPNMTPEEVAALPEDEYERLRALYAAAGVIEDVDRSAQMSEVEAASARRMGHSGSDS